MNFKWLGPLALLAALFIGDQIRINRPGHKYRLTVEVETPEGIKSASGVMSVHPDRGYSRRGHTAHQGRCRVGRSRRRQESCRAAGAYRQDDRSRRNELCGVARLQGRRPQRVVQRDEPDDRRGAGDRRADSGAGDLRRPERSRDRAQRCRRTIWKRRSARDFTSTAFPPRWCRTGLAARFRRPARRARDPRDRGEIAVVEAVRTIAAAIALRAAGLPAGEGIDAKEAFTRK